MSNKPKPTVDCIVIGGGMSGLAAAADLCSNGHSVLLLEARDRLGGRIHTLTEGFPCPVDSGASFVHGIEGNPLAELARQNNIALSFPMEENGGIAYDGKGAPDYVLVTALLIDKIQTGPPFPPELSAKLSIRIFSTLFFKSRIAAQTELNPRLSESLASWLFAPDSPLFEGLSKDEAAIVKEMTSLFDGWTGAALEQVSLRWWGFEREFGGPDGVVRNGYVDFLKVLEGVVRAKGGRIDLGREVVGVKLREDEEGVVVSHRPSVDTSSSSSAEEETEASFAICTLPLGVMRGLPASFFAPPLPPRRHQSLSRLGFGLLNKVILSYPSAFWPEEPAWIEFLPSAEDIEAKDPILGHAIGAQNYVPITGKPVLVVFAGASSGEALEKEDPTALEERLRRKFTRHFFHDKKGSAPKADRCVITKWRSDRWSKGSYAYLPVAKAGKEAQAATPLDMIELSRPLWEGRLRFAGEATAVDHYASVHGALMTGRAEAQSVHASLSGQTA